MYEHVVARKDKREEDKATGRKTERSSKSKKSAQPVITGSTRKEYKRPITAVPAL
jgi:hypothetical protein